MSLPRVSQFIIDQIVGEVTKNTDKTCRAIVSRIRQENPAILQGLIDLFGPDLNEIEEDDLLELVGVSCLVYEMLARQLESDSYKPNIPAKSSPMTSR